VRDDTAVAATGFDVAGERLTVATLSDLLAPEGVALPAVDDPVVAVIAVPPRRRLALAPRVKGTGAGGHIEFEGAEHTYLGDNAQLHFPTQSGPAKLFPLHMANGLTLTYGQIVALGGDFFGLPDQPISDDPSPPARFDQAFATLATDKAALAQVPPILKVMQTEIDAVNAAIAAQKQPSSAYADLGDWLTGAYNRATGGGQFLPEVPPGRYLQLAATNWDHFGAGAVQCYTVGHGVALAAAVKAAHAPAAQTRQMLEIAYATNAFADHYLTDIFASGHMRTPRKALYDTVTPSLLGSLLSKFMHDEDNAFGLKVTNKNGDKWTAYGDKRLLDTVNQDGLKRVQAAVQASVDEVWQAFQSGSMPVSKVLDLAPDLAKVSVPTDTTNPSPLFVEQNGVVLVRAKLADQKDHNWTAGWIPIKTYADLKALPEFSGLEDGYVPAELETDILQFRDDGGQVGIVEYGIMDDGSYGTKSSTTTVSPGPAALAWIPVDMDGDGQTEVVQIWDNGGQLGMTVYEPSPAGYRVQWWGQFGADQQPHDKWWIPVDMDGDGRTELVHCWAYGRELGMTVYAPQAQGYGPVWHQDDMNEGFGAMAWIPVDMDGDGKTELVQCWQNGTTLGMIAYEPSGLGYQFRWQENDMKQGPWGSPWIPVDVDGDGKTEIVQCWGRGGGLGMNVYAPSGLGYACMWSDTFNEGPGAIGWHVADVNGDDKSELLQLWDHGGRLGMVSYRPVSGQRYAYRVAWQDTDVGQPSAAVGWLDLVVGAGGETALAQLVDNGGQLGLIAYQAALDASWRAVATVPDLKHKSDHLFFATAASGVPIVPS
jgi:hypothetical protein